MACSGITAISYRGMAASCHTLQPVERVPIQLKHFHGTSTSMGISHGGHLGLQGYSKRKLSSNRIVQMLGVPEERKKVLEFDFKKYMHSKTVAVNEALDRAVPLCFPENLLQSMRCSVLSGGERVRPVLCIAACELVGGTEELSMPVACAIEMIHTMTLLHDEISSMDKPANHKVFGEATAALLVGNALHSYAFDHIAVSTSKTVGGDRVVRVVSELGRARGSQRVAGGQVAEGHASVDLETLQWIDIQKTAVLLECSAVCGAIIGGASEDEIERIRGYASCLGFLFQVVDDIFNVTKSLEELGKDAGKDFVSDKVTYPKLMGLEKSKQFTFELLERAKGYLSSFDPEKAAPLLGIADYIAFRQK